MIAITGVRLALAIVGVWFVASPFVAVAVGKLLKQRAEQQLR